MELNGLKVYDIQLSDNTKGIMATSLVSNPSIESNFLKFSKEELLIPEFKFASEDKQEIVGAIMIPDKPIYRNVNGHEFYVNFSKEVIAGLTQKMITNGMAGMFTAQHKIGLEQADIQPMEIWIKETENDKSMDFGIDEPVGTAFMKAKVINENLWTAIKENGLNGFSIELEASIVEAEKITNFKNEKNMIEEMFKNQVEVNGVQLYFKDELGKSTLLFSDNEGIPSLDFSGDFTKNDLKYSVENGVIMEVEDVTKTIDEKFSSIKETITEFGTKLETLFAKEQKLAEDTAELELLKTQFEEEKIALASGDAGTPVKLGFAAQMRENSKVSKSWSSKFVTKQ